MGANADSFRTASNAGRGICQHGCANPHDMLKTVERRQIYQEEIIPESALDELIREYGKRWPLKETPGSLGELLEVLL